ncbi:hypothetical protein [Rhodonellum sp.]|uniref:hypothetical protein n=1 Tax=Rhodonellum sp. TaxID=2231180 RepID=UPI002724C1F2|nr:hypothetical protein [Rhodonellum sp.]MDO9553723.1 hypothetical protein [Rhodonellum sp.]
MEHTKGNKISILKSLEEKNINLDHARMLLKFGIVGFIVLDEKNESEKHLEALRKYGIEPYILKKRK